MFLPWTSTDSESLPWLLSLGEKYGRNWSRCRLMRQYQITAFSLLGKRTANKAYVSIVGAAWWV